MIVYRIEKCEPSPESRHKCAHKLLSTMLTEYTNHIYSELKKDANGRPYIDSVAFSLSHCDDVAVVAMCIDECKSDKDIMVADTNCEYLGVDVECVSSKTKEKCKMIAERKFFKSENALLLACVDEESYIKTFCKLWTKKESYCKFTGEGLSGALGFDTQVKSEGVQFYTNFVTVDGKCYAVSLSYCSIKEK